MTKYDWHETNISYFPIIWFKIKCNIFLLEKYFYKRKEIKRNPNVKMWCKTNDVLNIGSDFKNIEIHAFIFCTPNKIIAFFFTHVEHFYRFLLHFMTITFVNNLS